MVAYLEQKILPAVTFEDAGKAIKVAEAFLDAGLNTMEIPFRTAEAARAVRLIASNFPKMHIGAGTLLQEKDLLEAKAAGAKFGLSPGLNPNIVKAAQKMGFDFIPGIMTPTELELGLELGCLTQKLFPVEQIGGIEFIKALSGPYGGTGVQFVPMGGVTLQNMRHYLMQPMVIAIGGSWLAGKDKIEKDDYGQIRHAVTAALEVIKGLDG
jgi:2-dehydro-3-deoxyphosphogluconate aldolase / (4S)-4-hydroxy-2-oxoglutarate aldolase